MSLFGTPWSRKGIGIREERGRTMLSVVPVLAFIGATRSRRTDALQHRRRRERSLKALKIRLMRICLWALVVYTCGSFMPSLSLFTPPPPYHSFTHNSITTSSLRDRMVTPPATQCPVTFYAATARSRLPMLIFPQVFKFTANRHVSPSFLHSPWGVLWVLAEKYWVINLTL